MQELLKDLLMVVITAAVPVLTVYLVGFIRKVGDNAAANAVSVEASTYITEITEAIAAAVAATNQTYVDALKMPARLMIRHRLRPHKRPWRLAWPPSVRRQRHLLSLPMAISGST